MLTEQFSLANEYLASVKRGTQIEDGWASKECAYSISKSCMTAFTAILSRQHPELLINCCCPGRQPPLL